MTEPWDGSLSTADVVAACQKRIERLRAQLAIAEDTLAYLLRTQERKS